MPAWLHATLARLLAEPPPSCPAAAAVTACRPEALDVLTASPREVCFVGGMRGVPERVRRTRSLGDPSPCDHAALEGAGWAAPGFARPVSMTRPRIPPPLAPLLCPGADAGADQARASSGLAGASGAGRADGGRVPGLAALRSGEAAGMESVGAQSDCWLASSGACSRAPNLLGDPDSATRQATQDANCQNVADWFQSFADVRGSHGARKKGRKAGAKAADAKVRCSLLWTGFCATSGLPSDPGCH